MSDFRIERVIDGPRDQVISAWREPRLIAEWFCPNPSMSTMAEADVQSGGLYRITMGEHIVTGNYQEVELPERLVFTWRWEHEPDTAPSTVRVTFTDRDGRTELLLEHVDLPDADDATSHGEGWTMSLDRLDHLVRSM